MFVFSRTSTVRRGVCGVILPAVD
ncbi:MAG TPA: hypothetical protein ENJ51_06660 [Leucothrix mucor]|uniref:Uncharacterized protein n=1 Tax=Leucothrix mucor TaxID=45248 RepID=A0A7V2T0Q6_LEUMU|nr:hypothetical protein [Leucothrix mucor]